MVPATQTGECCVSTTGENWAQGRTFSSGLLGNSLSVLADGLCRTSCSKKIIHVVKRLHLLGERPPATVTQQRF